jgi:hypothetical protein
MKYNKNYNDFLNEDQSFLNERKVKLTNDHKAEMLKIAQDLSASTRNYGHMASFLNLVTPVLALH